MSMPGLGAAGGGAWIMASDAAKTVSNDTKVLPGSLTYSIGTSSPTTAYAHLLVH